MTLDIKNITNKEIARWVSLSALFSASLTTFLYLDSNTYNLVVYLLTPVIVFVSLAFYFFAKTDNEMKRDTRELLNSKSKKYND